MLCLSLQLPSEVQAKVRTYVAQKRCPTDAAQPDVKSITVPISTFPPTAMVYNITKPTVEKHSDDDDAGDECKPPVDVVSAAIMAKVLEDREKERIYAKHCDTCTCHRSILLVDAVTQTCLPSGPAFFGEEQTHRNVEKYVSETLNGEKRQSADKLSPSPAVSHTVFYQINENVTNGEKTRHHANGDCSAIYVTQPTRMKDKLVGRNGRSAQDCSTEENFATKASLNKKNSCQGQRSPSFSRLNDLNRINVDKAKPLRAGNKKCDPQIDSNKSTTRYWNKSERSSFDRCSGTGSTHADKEQTHIDIINDRLWKNEWTKWKSEMSADSKCGANRGIELDVINDRDWKNDRSAERQEARLNVNTQFTLIEVKSPDNSASNNDGSQTEVATSPSFSSDSMVISSSDPSSSCSDVAQPLTGVVVGGETPAVNFNNAKSVGSSQGRAIGPRNCLVRVTPGSKNILLDNAGHYKTVLYSSAGSKASAALVHAKKASLAGSERSTSTSSEDNNSPVLLQDNQLQRVAEWVQSSLCVDNSTAHGSDKTKCGENTGEKCGPASLSVHPNDSPPKSKSSEQDASGTARNAPKNAGGYCEIALENGPSDVSPLLSSVECADKSENLITFEVLDEHSLKDPRKTNLDYEVKITKEMEETYLKLAASLDPVTLSLSRSSNAELTIEKYRKDHKRLHHVQRIQDKAGSKA